MGRIQLYKPVIVIVSIAGWLGIGMCADWIDPHAMVFSPEKLSTTYKHVQTANSADTSIIQVLHEDRSNQRVSDVFLKRILALLLYNSRFERTNFDENRGHVQIVVKDEDYAFLMKFLQLDNVYLEDIQRVVSILEDGLKQSSLERFLYSFNTFYHHITINSEMILVSLITSIVLYCVYRALRYGVSYRNIIFHLVFIAYVVDWVLIFINLRNKHDIDVFIKQKEMEGIGSECNPNKMTWIAYFMYFLGRENPCRDYFIVTNINRNLIVTPSQVFLTQLETLIVKPFSYIGSALGGFTLNMSNTMPYGIGILLMPFIILVAPCLFVVMCLIATNTPLKLSLLHLFNIEVGKNDTVNICNDHHQRPMIEDVTTNDTVPAAIEPASSDCKIIDTDPVPYKCDDGSKNHEEEIEEKWCLERCESDEDTLSEDFEKIDASNENLLEIGSSSESVS